MMVEMTYEELLVKFKNCEIDNRKHRLSFVQRLCEYLAFDVPYTRYKSLVLGNSRPESLNELKVKNVCDAYHYLVANPKSFFGETLLKKFYYLMTENELDREIALNLQSFYHDFDDKPILVKIIDLHFRVYQVFYSHDEGEKTIIAFLLLNYLLIVHHLAPVRLFQRDFIAYEKIRGMYEQGDDQAALIFFIDMIRKQKPFSKQFYASLTPITTNELVSMIKQDEDMLRKMYRVARLAIFGSFAGHRVRYDSDIDILVKFEQDMSYEDKERSMVELRRFMFHRYERICDVHDILSYMDENHIKGYEPYIKVF